MSTTRNDLRRTSPEELHQALHVQANNERIGTVTFYFCLGIVLVAIGGVLLAALSMPSV